MTTRQRVAITAGCALVSAVTALGSAWTADTGGQAWPIATLASYGLALVGAFFVNRWWATLPAASAAVVGWLGSLVYQPSHPWHEEAAALPVGIWVAVMVLRIGLPAAFIALGLVARRIWDELRDKGASASGGVER